MNMNMHDPFASYVLPPRNIMSHDLRVSQHRSDRELPVLLEGSSSGKRQRKSGDDQENSCGNSESKKKNIVHRDIERHRRQEMATLYKALRLQLPIEYLRGKRSISDHMHEAVNYIKHLKSKIEEMSIKREQLQLQVVPSQPTDVNNDQYPEYCCSGDRCDAVVVKSCLSGVEVMMSTGCSSLSRPGRVQQLPLSRILDVLVGEGLSVVSCVSARVNHRLLHTIESEVIDDGKGIDISALQQKLTSIAAVSFSNKGLT